MTQISHLIATFTAATTIKDVGSFSISDDGVTTITIGMNTDYPPYATEDDKGEFAGFGVDFGYGLNDVCPSINIEFVLEYWPNCWSDDDGGQVGKSIADGTVDGCLAYYNTFTRDEHASFSDAMIEDNNKAAGMLTLLDQDGNPKVSGMDNLQGKTLIDVAGWAPSGEALKYLSKNSCTGEHFKHEDVNLLLAEAEDPSDNPNNVAITMLREGKGDFIFLHSNMGETYRGCPDDAVWDCDLWDGFGTEFAYIQTGQVGYVKNGTAFAISKKGSGIKELLRPCMSKYMASEAYYRICSKWNILDKCYRNEYFDEDKRSVQIYEKKTSEQFGSCSNGYCPCSAGVSVDAAADDGDDGLILPSWAIATVVAGSVVLIVALYGGYKLCKRRRKVHQQAELEEQQVQDLKRRVLSHGGGMQSPTGVMVVALDVSATVSSGHTPP